MTTTAELLGAARAAATAATELLRDVRPADIRHKGTLNDLITEWDLRSEEVIRRVLAEHTPGISVLGEEGGLGGEAANRAENDARWIVDPIDGTVNFAHGLPIWAVSIGLEVAGQLEVGVVSAPQLGWWFEASRGGGARDGGGAPLAVSAVAQLPHAMLTTGFPYDRATRPDNNFAEWEHFQRRAGACRRLGAASLDLCLVARGWMDGYWERHLKPWDIAAGLLIVTQTRGGVEGLARGPVRLFQRGGVGAKRGIPDEVRPQAR